MALREQMRGTGMTRGSDAMVAALEAGIATVLPVE